MVCDFATPIMFDKDLRHLSGNGHCTSSHSNNGVQILCREKLFKRFANCPAFINRRPAHRYVCGNKCTTVGRSRFDLTAYGN
ncbi:hypothetical protein LSAT2_011083 [Lamellibrachia satsuma]|nr:hypothetical protein LSAT2_011083 [Lamellibrachia satsuma]